MSGDIAFVGDHDIMTISTVEFIGDRKILDTMTPEFTVRRYWKHRPQSLLSENTGNTDPRVYCHEIPDF